MSIKRIVQDYRESKEWVNNHKLDMSNTYKHGPECMLDELSTIELLYVGNNLVVYRYKGTTKEVATSKDHWLEWAHIVD